VSEACPAQPPATPIDVWLQDQKRDGHKRMVTDLEGIAMQGGFVLPAMLGNAHQKVYDDVSGETGIGFDLAYIKRIREEHKRLLKRYESMAEDAKDMEVKQFASKQLPLLRQERQHQQLRQQRHHCRVAEGCRERCAA
jgi:putative membrane protein